VDYGVEASHRFKEVSGHMNNTETILRGRGNQITPIPRQVVENHLLRLPEHFQARLAFKTEAHHQVRYFVVRELPRLGQSIGAETISRELGLPLEQVSQILDELEKNLFFLVRDEGGAVCWAYPVTVEETPHRIRFNSGERLYAA